MIRELKTFLAVAERGTFAAAGERIGLTQAAVSAQMQRLESELGFQLFDRTGRSARLNVRGHQTLQRAQELILLYSRLGSSKVGQDAMVRIQIGAITSVQRSLLPQALARFHKSWSNCTTRVVPGVSMDLVHLVDAGEIDMAIVIKPPFPLHSDLRWTTLASEPFRLLVPRKVEGDDWAALLASQPFVRYDRASFGGRQVDRFLRGHHIAVRELCELDELDAIVKLVAHGVGIALVPQTHAGRHWPASIKALDLGAHTFHRDIGLVHRSMRTLTEPVRQLVEAVSKVYAA